MELLLLQAPSTYPSPPTSMTLITDPQPSVACAFEEGRQQLDYADYCWAQSQTNGPKGGTQPQSHLPFPQTGREVCDEGKEGQVWPSQPITAFQAAENALKTETSFITFDTFV